MRRKYLKKKTFSSYHPTGTSACFFASPDSNRPLIQNIHLRRLHPLFLIIRKSEHRVKLLRNYLAHISFEHSGILLYKVQEDARTISRVKTVFRVCLRVEDYKKCINARDTLFAFIFPCELF